ncbi:MAG: Wzz/FepE/Etk N-terminal domain-containing protein [Actinomycetota bacterium]|nr:Wzz/FepE/Etk N-terminal domain-containing protein [Actinomycetota bacterium]
MVRSNETAVELSDYLAVLRRRKVLILIATLVGLAGGLAYSFSRPAVYTSTAKVLISPTRISSTPTSVSMATEQEIVVSEAVARLAARNLEDQGDLDAIISRVDVTIPTESLVLYIAYSAKTPEAAQEGAQSFASAYIAYRAPLESITSDIIAPADLPSAPSSPNPPLEAGLGTVLGLFAGIVLAYFRDRTDERIRSLGEVEQIFGVPVLAILHEDPTPAKRGFLRRRTPRPRSIAAERPDSREAAPFRTLGAAVARRIEQHRIQTLLIAGVSDDRTSAVTAGNLAVVLAQMGRKTTLVSGNVRSPQVHEFFDLPNEGGLGAALGGRVPAAEAAEDTPVSGLRVVPAGPTDATIMVVQGRVVLGVLADLAASTDVTVLDAPALRAHADGLTLAQFVDAVVLVVDAGHDRHGVLAQVAVDLDAVAARVLGVVLVNTELNLIEG